MTRSSRYRIVILAAFASAVAFASRADPFAPVLSAHAVEHRSAGPRVVAVGDIHGAFDSLTAILREAGIVDEQLRWSGGDTIFVQTGDFTDRGPEVRRCIELLMRVQQEARRAGGRMVVLLANHEIMNLVGVYRDVAPEEYEHFVDAESERRRDDAWEDWKDVQIARAEMMEQPAPELGEAQREAWNSTHPLGFVERVEAFGPDGEYGEWLRELPTAVEVDDTLFMHAGVNPELADNSADDISEQVHGEIERHDDIREEMIEKKLIAPTGTLDDMVIAANDELGRLIAEYGPDSGRRPSAQLLAFAERLESIINIIEWQLLNPEGFLWFRDYAMWTEVEGTPLVAGITEKLGVEHIVVAHTTQADFNVKARFEGRVFLIDTGMLTEHYGGRPSALEIVDGTFTAVYVGERAVLLSPDRALPALNPVSPAPSAHRAAAAPLSRGRF